MARTCQDFWHLTLVSWNCDLPGCFALDERPGRRTLFHVITSNTAFRAMGYRQLDLYIPIRVIE